MTAFLIALFFVFIAELGDKTQLVALAFATRYRPMLVLVAVFVATLLVHLFSVLVGEVLGLALPVFWIKILAGLAFIGFGIWTLRGDELGEEEKLSQKRFGPFMTVAVTFFLAEIGDKTMLATITIASQQQSFIPVWLGSTIGMVIADGLAIIVGAVMGKRLPERLIQIIAALIFIGSGIFTLVEAFMA
ncbi:MAG: TMEM165/GDT1 family protein [Chloroflexota bacterium]|nr:TMEM165/GDT1 family protein [Chloroflexota bacterium]